MIDTRKIAVLDVDGTLLPGALGVDLLRALLAADACERCSALAVFDALAEYRSGATDFSTMATRAYRSYAAALAGREVELVERVAREVWAARRGELFAFVPRLLATLREHGYAPMLISGSPIEMVGLVATELDIAEVHGAVFGRRGGRYVGSVDLSSGMPGEKARIFAHATRGRELDLSRCFAIGDSITDAALFERVGCSLVFEPDAPLAAIARDRGWTLASHADVLARVHGLLSSPPNSARASC